MKAIRQMGRMMVFGLLLLCLPLSVDGTWQSMVVSAAAQASSGSGEAREIPSFRMTVSDGATGIRVQIFGDGLHDVYAYELRLLLDGQAFKLIDAELAASGFPVGPIVERNRIRLAFTKVGAAQTIVGSVRLAELTLERVAPGISSIELREVELIDSGLNVYLYKPGIEVSLRDGGALSDVSGHWAETSIRDAVEAGWVTGYADGAFRPEREVSRAELAALLARALTLPAAEESIAFADREEIPDWAEAHVDAAASAGLLRGYPDAAFRPSRPVTRAELAAVVVRAAGIETHAGSRPLFADTASIAEWAQPYVSAGADVGLIAGRSGNRFAPEERATRAEAVVWLERVRLFLENRDE